MSLQKAHNKLLSTVKSKHAKLLSRFVRQSSDKEELESSSLLGLKSKIMKSAFKTALKNWLQQIPSSNKSK